MLRIFVCSVLLILVMAGIGKILHKSFDWFGWWGGFWFCLAFTATMVAIGFAVDAADNRSR